MAIVLEKIRKIHEVKSLCFILRRCN